MSWSGSFFSSSWSLCGSANILFCTSVCSSRQLAFLVLGIKNPLWRLATVHWNKIMFVCCHHYRVLLFLSKLAEILGSQVCAPGTGLVWGLEIRLENFFSVSGWSLVLVTMTLVVLFSVLDIQLATNNLSWLLLFSFGVAVPVYAKWFACQNLQQKSSEQTNKHVVLNSYYKSIVRL